MKIIYLILAIISLNMMFFLAQKAVAEISEDIYPGEDHTIFFDPGSNMINDFDEGNYTLQDPSARIPSDNEAVDPDTGNSWLTDMWKTVKNALYESTGLGYIMDIVNALPNFLKAIGVPQEIAFALGFIWHVLSITAIIIFLRGGS